VLPTARLRKVWQRGSGLRGVPVLLRFVPTRGRGARRRHRACSYAAPRKNKAKRLATRTELSDFLAEVERRAYKQALFAIRDDHQALDIVQDAMLKLSEKYSDRPPAELPLLFQRILQNGIRDYYRRQKVRSLWTTPVSALFGSDGEEDFDPLETLEVESESQWLESPPDQLNRAQVLGLIEKALEKLPARQRQAFLLRYWEEMDVAEAAQVMGCSQGSVKTHCSRATHALAALLEKQGIKL
jgi:RNA polymerase sigma-70 factor (ECF subfamily)